MSVRVERIGNATLYLARCEDVLGDLSLHDALVTDPPYGIDAAESGHMHGGTPSPKWRGAKRINYGPQTWDNQTSDALYLALDIASHAIVFGGNYYELPPAQCWLVWDKETNGSLADCELAWTNLPKAVRRIRYLWNGFARANGEPSGDHPTQKPLGVMRWALGHLPNCCSTILDPFAGSGTTGVAAVQLGLRFTGIEMRPQYFEAMCRRIEQAQRQGDLLRDMPPAEDPADARMADMFSGDAG